MTIIITDSNNQTQSLDVSSFILLTKRRRFKVKESDISVIFENTEIAKEPFTKKKLVVSQQAYKVEII